MEIVIATKNRGKASEIREILKGLDVKLLTLEDFPGLDLPPEGTGTFMENALAKARFVSVAAKRPALADDSGIEVDFLRGRPGVLSARFAGEGASDEENYRKLLKELEGAPPDQRRARFRCAMAFVEPGGGEHVFEGVFEGSIAAAPRGVHGFGYDPVFLVPGEARTAAELAPEEKNSISHRARALAEFRKWLKKKMEKN